ncbi:MAG: ribonuclease III [Parcubacteria group bacterium SW_6_46_9]|nr:MAG: ribonuclease III [Parcubacteria group bacterium SW_6_46_9]
MSHAKDITQLQQEIGLNFNDIDVLKKAVTHRSYLNENPDEDLHHNERLEFLGDAVLELVTTDYLFQNYPNRPEGELTAIRAALVNTESIATSAKTVGLNPYLRLSKGERQDTGRGRQFILANTYEAVIGAVYVDQGYTHAKEFIAETLLTRAEQVITSQNWRDAKSVFQEKAQEYVSITPEYKTLDESGPDHDKIFTVGVFLEDKKVAEGQGKSKQDAESEAAQKALDTKDWG